MKMSIFEYMQYLGGTENTKCIVEGENFLNAGNLMFAGQLEANDNFMKVYALCLQSTTSLNSDPYEIKGTLNKQNSVTVESMFCSCKAGNSGKCEHISAFLVKCIREDVESLEKISPADIKSVWSTQKDKFKPVPIDDMPCLKKKVKKMSTTVDKEQILNFFCQSLPNSAIAKHRQGKRPEYHEEVNKSLESSRSDPEDRSQAILNNARQSACMLHLASFKIQKQKNCCSKLFSKIFPEDDGNEKVVINFQKHSSEWIKQRKYRVTGSRCYDLFTYSKNEWDAKARNYFDNPNPLNNKYFKHDLKWEHRAREVFQKSTAADTFECGMVISHSNKWLGYSPDGIIFSEGNPAYLLALKCALEGSTNTILEALPEITYVIQEDGEFKLKKQHKYYGEIQMGMALLNLAKTFFVIYASFDDSILVMEIEFDYEFAINMLSVIKKNYFNKMLHVLCEKQD